MRDVVLIPIVSSIVVALACAARADLVAQGVRTKVQVGEFGGFSNGTVDDTASHVRTTLTSISIESVDDTGIGEVDEVKGREVSPFGCGVGAVNSVVKRIFDFDGDEVEGLFFDDDGGVAALLIFSDFDGVDLSGSVEYLHAAGVGPGRDVPPVGRVIALSGLEHGASSGGGKEGGGKGFNFAGVS